MVTYKYTISLRPLKMFNSQEEEYFPEFSRALGWFQTHFTNYSVTGSNWLPLMEWLLSIYLDEEKPSIERICLY